MASQEARASNAAARAADARARAEKESEDIKAPLLEAPAPMTQAEMKARAAQKQRCSVEVQFLYGCVSPQAIRAVTREFPVAVSPGARCERTRLCAG